METIVCALKSHALLECNRAPSSRHHYIMSQCYDSRKKGKSSLISRLFCQRPKFNEIAESALWVFLWTKRKRYQCLPLAYFTGILSSGCSILQNVRLRSRQGSIHDMGSTATTHYITPSSHKGIQASRKEQDRPMSIFRQCRTSATQGSKLTEA